MLVSTTIESTLSFLPWLTLSERASSTARSLSDATVSEPIWFAQRIRVVSSGAGSRSEEHTSELQSRQYLVCRLLLEKKTISSKTKSVGLCSRGAPARSAAAAQPGPITTKNS